MFTAAKALAELGRLRDENRALRDEVDALRRQAAKWEDGRRALQWDNLLNYDGRVQNDNLGGGLENGRA